MPANGIFAGAGVEHVLSRIVAGLLPEVRTRDPFTQALLRWTARMQQRAVVRWRPVAQSGIRCSLGSRDKGPCGQPAAGACLLCRQPVCLDHAAVAPNGALSCIRCLDTYAAVVRDMRDKGPAPASSASAESSAVREQHLATLELPSEATWNDIRAAFRALSKKWHPDTSKVSGAAERYAAI